MRTTAFPLVLILVLSACAPSPTAVPQPLATLAVPAPTEPPASATAGLDPSYPTLQASVAAAEQAASGIQVRLERVWQDGKNLNADVCFTIPDAADWSVLSGSLSAGELVLREFGVMQLSFQEPSAGVPGLRCESLNFVVPPDAILANGTLTIDAIAAFPREDEYCTVYLPKIQRSLEERGIAITLDCVDSNGMLTMQITGRPPDMSEEESQAIVYSDEFYSVRGPWSFSFSLAQ